MPLHRVNRRFITCDEYLNDLLCQPPRDSSLPLVALTGRFQGFLNHALARVAASSLWLCALNSLCCPVLLCRIQSPFSRGFLVNRGHMLLARPGSPPDSPLGGFPPPLLCTCPPEMTAVPTLQVSLCRQAGGWASGQHRCHKQPRPPQQPCHVLPG